MLVEVKVPVLAESISEATLMNWHKHIGDEVKRGESLIDIETDKVTLEIAALNNGVIVEILKADGELVQSDEVIARIDTDIHEKITVAGTTGQVTVPEQQYFPDMEPVTSTPQIKLSPAVRNLIEEHHLDAAIIPKSGNNGRLTKEDVLHYLADKPVAAVTTEVPTLMHLAGDEYPEEIIPAKATMPAAPEVPAIESTADASPEKDEIPVAYVPATRAEPEIPAIVSAADAAPEMDELPVTTVPADHAAPEVSVPMHVAEGRPEKKVPMTRLRKRVAERLLAAQHENAILTTFNEINMQPVIDMRTRYREEFEKTHGVKLGFMSFFTRATVEALKKFPVINASVDGRDIIYHGYFDIGIAVSTPRGLVVPIVRNADVLSLAEIEIRIREFGEKALDASLTIDELTGGTFTITNGGIFGSLLSTPIINPPQSAILGMHKIQQRPIAEDGAVVIRPMMYVALSYDHRIIDGSEAVQFLVVIKQQIEDPTRLMLQI